ncbi:protein of unknown function [Terribacillus halophilus]|uniref:Uncharacterized protein n=1 Tax=Terribacillus halophilus TaxID=361279 RepID=A0A1G6RRN8_9BACI|nr:protein of unknown function [Terribacillus halophilus]
MGYYDHFDASTDFRKHTDKYRVGRGEQGVLMVEPYKSETLPHWRFKTSEIKKNPAEDVCGIPQAGRYYRDEYDKEEYPDGQYPGSSLCPLQRLQKYKVED